ncbi:MAG TPA: DUF4367 domain-containing protein [Anaerolineales bacterium]|nr:DUF4367 domain-containing protein [Anaerolineales bacterium]
MNKKRNIWIVGGAVLLLVLLVSAFVFMQPSAKDILVQTLETAKTIENGHAVVNIKVDSPEEKASAKIEVWGRHDDDESGAFRLEVLETDKAEAVGAVIVSDGESVWAYSPAKNTVFTGTAEEAKAAMEEKQPMQEEFNIDEFDHPETAEEAVDKLLEYFDVSRTGTEQIADANAYQIELKPIPDQMPSEYTAVGGLLNLWIDQNRSVPLAFEYTGGAMGELHVTTLELEINQGVDESLFTFEIPDGAEVVGFEDFADMKPESLSLDEAADSVEFAVLIPDVLPDGATLVDVLNVRGMIVQQYTLTDGGSFSVAQGQVEGANKPSTEEQTVEVRGVTGSLFVSEEHDKVLLTWSEDDVIFVISGSLTAEQALEIAESLK